MEDPHASVLAAIKEGKVALDGGPWAIGLLNELHKVQCGEVIFVSFAWLELHWLPPRHPIVPLLRLCSDGDSVL